MSLMFVCFLIYIKINITMKIIFMIACFMGPQKINFEYHLWYAYHTLGNIV